VIRSCHDAARSLFPILLLLGLFWWWQVGEPLARPGMLVLGMALVIFGVGSFLHGVRTGINPLAQSLANQIAARGSMVQLLGFSFALGFGAVIAEPSLAAIAERIEQVSEGELGALRLRLIAASSVGLAMALGVLAIISGHGLKRYLIIGYLALLPITLFTPVQVTGLGFDAGAVSANMVVVPLLVALGLGLLQSVARRTGTLEGFGLVGLAVMAPRVGVQLYGLLAYGSTGTAPSESVLAQPVDVAGSFLQDLLQTLVGMAGSAAPIILVVLAFQFLVLGAQPPHARKVLVGSLLALVGLMAFSLGLLWALFPLGEKVAEALTRTSHIGIALGFFFLLGVTAALVEPALTSTAERAQRVQPDLIHALGLRVLTGAGVGLGVLLAGLRLYIGLPLEWLLVIVILCIVMLSLLAPVGVMALAFDLGGIATSDVTVPLVTAIGLGLASYTAGADPLLDGFGFVALASLMPVVVVLGYISIVAQARSRWVRRSE
jgi:hypothetical protein